jgi:hypothetical protein
MFRCEAALDPLADIAQRESRRPLYRNSSTSATSKGQKRTHTNNPGGPGFVCLGGKLEETIRVTAYSISSLVKLRNCHIHTACTATCCAS